MSGPRVFSTAEIDPKEFKRLMIELEGVGSTREQRSILSNAGKAAMLIVRDETIRGYQKAGSNFRGGGGAFLAGITAKGSYSVATIKRRGREQYDVVQWINFKKNTNRLVHLFDQGFTPGGGGLKKGRRNPRRPISGWNTRRKALARKDKTVERVFLNAMRILLDLGKKKRPSVGQLRTMGGG